MNIACGSEKRLKKATNRCKNVHKMRVIRVGQDALKQVVQSTACTAKQQLQGAKGDCKKCKLGSHGSRPGG